MRESVDDIVILSCCGVKGVIGVVPWDINFGLKTYAHLIGHAWPFWFFVGRRGSCLGGRWSMTSVKHWLRI